MFCVNILIIVLFRVLISNKSTFRTAISAHQVIISISVWYGKYTTHGERSGSVVECLTRDRGFEPHRRHCVVVLEQDTFILA